MRFSRRILPLFSALLCLLAVDGPGQQRASLDHKLQIHSFRFGFVGAERVRLGVSVLRNQEERTYDTRLTAGREYFFLAVCDDNCSDVDLFLRQNGFQLDEDTEPDAYPVVRFLARQTGVYQVTVRMEGCSRRCGFEVDQYSR